MKEFYVGKESEPPDTMNTVAVGDYFGGSIFVVSKREYEQAKIEALQSLYDLTFLGRSRIYTDSPRGYEFYSGGSLFRNRPS